MPYLLNLIYILLLILVSPWLVVQAVRKGKYREGYAEKLLGLVPRRSGGGTCVWLHAVSVGEVNLLAPLLEMIDHKRPGWECVVFDDHHDRYGTGPKKISRPYGFLLPVGFLLGGESGHAARPPGLARAG